MSTLDKLNSIALKLQMGEATSHEVDTVLIQLLSSSYNEGKYRHDETMRILGDIQKLIEDQNKRIEELEIKQNNRISTIENQLNIIRPVVGVITSIATIVMGWATYQVLDRMF